MPGMNYWSLHFRDPKDGPKIVQKRLITAPDDQAARQLAREYVGNQTGRHWTGPLAGQPLGQIVFLGPYEARS